MVFEAFFVQQTNFCAHELAMNSLDDEVVRNFVFYLYSHTFITSDRKFFNLKTIDCAMDTKIQTCLKSVFSGNKSSLCDFFQCILRIPSLKQSIFMTKCGEIVLCQFILFFYPHTYLYTCLFMCTFVYIHIYFVKIGSLAQL